MNKKSIRVSAARLESFLEFLEEEDTDEDAAHLVTEQVVGYVLEALEEDELEYVQEHLAICEECRARVEEASQGAAPWKGEAGQERVVHLNAIASAVIAGTPELIKVLADYDRPAWVRAKIIPYLAEILGGDVTSTLKRSAAEDPEVSVRKAACEAFLGRINVFATAHLKSSGRVAAQGANSAAEEIQGKPVFLNGGKERCGTSYLQPSHGGLLLIVKLDSESVPPGVTQVDVEVIDTIEHRLLLSRSQVPLLRAIGGFQFSILLIDKKHPLEVDVQLSAGTLT